MIPSLKLSTKKLQIVNIIHCIQLLLVSAVVGIGTYKMFGMKSPAAKSGARWALSVGAKSIIIIQYQLLTENVRRLNRFASAKAFFVLDVLEVTFWPAAAVLTVIAMTKYCEGTSCILSGVVVSLAAVLTVLGLPVLWIAFHHWREQRKAEQEVSTSTEIFGNSHRSRPIMTQEKSSVDSNV